MARPLDSRLAAVVAAAAMTLTITLAPAGCARARVDAQAEGGARGAAAGDVADPYPGYRSPTHADPAHWLCLPGRHDFCDVDLDATVVAADGSTRVERFVAAAEAPIDCFYVYPTVSVDRGANSDLDPDEAYEGRAVRNQAARLRSVCRLYAPVYRQVTLPTFLRSLRGRPVPRVSGVVAYLSVLDAWKQYIAHENRGRGVVLIGHSQGTRLLTTLIEREIDDEPVLRGRLVSAILLGGAIAVPRGGDVGGTFRHIPLCRAAAQVGCVITYASFAADDPPGPRSRFGRVEEGVAGCTNPANLAGGEGVLKPYFAAARDGGGLERRLGARAGAEPWARGVEIGTPWVTLPGLLSARCTERDGASYLEVTAHADAADPRTDDVGGGALPGFGLHLIDANLAMGNLVDIVRRQAAAYAEKKR